MHAKKKYPLSLDHLFRFPKDGAWMLWGNSSVAVAAVAAAVVAHPGFGGDAEILVFPEIKYSPQAAFDFLNYDFN